ncbi:uncharacterized protein L201_007412 [Kwoniella dendrophila CBS 6074]|uniref:Velvet domain-containing protein n=1 Tax=Kwoniella dendrophila CBS 6074 TaxID=1295534 RepID=A0AAX4K5Q5_9TREE
MVPDNTGTNNLSPNLLLTENPGSQLAQHPYSYTGYHNPSHLSTDQYTFEGPPYAGSLSSVAIPLHGPDHSTSQYQNSDIQTNPFANRSLADTAISLPRPRNLKPHPIGCSAGPIKAGQGAYRVSFESGGESRKLQPDEVVLSTSDDEDDGIDAGDRTEEVVEAKERPSSSRNDRKHIDLVYDDSSLYIDPRLLIQE